MHNIEFGLKCLSKIIEDEYKDTELSQLVEALASASHDYSSDIKDNINLDEIINVLSSRAKINI